MCTSIVEIVAAEGMAKREDEWFPLTHASVAYDHARHALLADVITIDFINEALPPGARAGVELTLDSGQGAACRIGEGHRRGRDRGGRAVGGDRAHAPSGCCARARCCLAQDRGDKWIGGRAFSGPAASPFATRSDASIRSGRGDTD